MVRVVDASVLDPDTARLVRLRVFALRVVNAAVWPVIFPTVVLASVEDPVA